MASHPASQPSTGARIRGGFALDAAIAVAVFAGSLALLAVGENAEGGGGVEPLGVVFAALASLPLVARRRAPVGVFVVTGLASSASYALAEPAGPPLGPTLAIYWLAEAGGQSRARTRLSLALVGAMLVAHAAAGGVGAGHFPASELLFGVLVWGGAWLAGDRTRLRHERMAELEDRALRAERDAERDRQLAAAEERTRIARDLHDSAGHAINVILVHAGLGRLRSQSDSSGAHAEFATIEQVARETVGEIDQLVGALREEGSQAEGLAEVEPPAGLAALGALAERHRAAGLDVATTVHGERRALPAAVDRAAYRILQEALTNAARHGGGRARVEVTFGLRALELTVANPLRGARAARSDGGGHGVVGMRERAALLGGSLEAGIRDGQFRVHARLPLGDDRA